MPPSVPNPTDSKNSFFGIKVTQPGYNVNAVTDNHLILKDDFSTRTYYDDSNNPVIKLGKQSDGSFSLTVGSGGITQIILGTLPDGTQGLAISKPGVDVYSAFS